MRVLLLGHGVVRWGVLCRWGSVVLSLRVSEDARGAIATRWIVSAWDISCYFERGQISKGTVLGYWHRWVLIVCWGAICDRWDRWIVAVGVCGERIITF